MNHEEGVFTPALLAWLVVILVALVALLAVSITGALPFEVVIPMWVLGAFVLLVGLLWFHLPIKYGFNAETKRDASQK